MKDNVLVRWEKGYFDLGGRFNCDLLRIVEAVVMQFLRLFVGLSINLNPKAFEWMFMVIELWVE